MSGRLTPEQLGASITVAADLAGIGVVVIEPTRGQLKRVFVSAAASAIAGHSAEEILAFEGLEPFIIEDRERAARVVEQWLSQRVRAGRFEGTFEQRSGRRVPVEITFTSLEVEGTSVVLLFIQDLTERRSAERQRDASEQRYRRLVEAAPDGVGIIQDGRFVFANPRACAILGFPSAAELMAAPLADVFDPADYQIMGARIGAMLESGEHFPPHVYTCVRPDGRRVRVEITSIPTEHLGRPAVLGFARDVTERAQMEARLAQADRLVALGTLAAGVAHEINNPLTFMYLRTAAMERWATRLDEELRKDFLSQLDDLRAGADRVSRIVQDLRTFSRSGGQAHGPSDLRTVLAFVQRIMGNEIKERANLVIECDDVPPVEGEQGRLEQVFLNLVLNAMQAMPDDATPEERSVTIRASVKGQVVVVEVADNGLGMPPDVAARAFDPFFTTKPVGVGTGLGLAICHGILTQLGGSIELHSTLGEGTTFRVTLPVRRSGRDEPSE